MSKSNEKTIESVNKKMDADKDANNNADNDAKNEKDDDKNADAANDANIRAKGSYQKKPFEKLTPKEARDKFDKIVQTYYDKQPHISVRHEYPELEAKFGTRGVKRITKIDYDNVIRKLVSLGFVADTNNGTHLLRMENQYLDPASGRFKMSNVRVEIDGIFSIHKYCETNLIQSVSTVAKLNVKEPIDSVDFDDYNFRLTYNIEKNVGKNGKMGVDILNKWDDSKKRFRYINRVSFRKPGVPVKIDISIVKTSGKTEKGFPKLFDSFRNSDVLSNPESYEIEIESDNAELGLPAFLKNGNAKILQEHMRKTIKHVLSGLQGTNYPISYVEQADTLQNYIRMLHKGPIDRRINSRDFIGPQPFTLQIKNIVPTNKNANDFNIRTGYVVTEKADGERNLLYINQLGKIYLINSSMKVSFTGTITTDKTLFRTLLDGELVMHDKNHNFINLYAAFDAYYLNGEDIRHHYFMPENEKDDVLKSRYYILSDIVTALNPMPIVQGELIAPLKIIYKEFYPKKSSESIFDACNTILSNINEGLFLYNTDGLIFTPINFGVGSYEKGKAGKLEKVPWECSFKWKPPQFNTIDFLVTTKKTPGGQDIVASVYESGVNANASGEMNQFKTIILECGINEKNDIYLNPCQDIIDDVLPTYIEDSSNNSFYKHVQFYPTAPYDPEAGLCNIMLKKDKIGANQMYTEEGEVFENNTIVEFSYEVDASNTNTNASSTSSSEDSSNKTNAWKWKPLRVRYDKTSELRNGMKNFGNDYRVANSNWTSIHNPISEEMLMHGANIPEISYDDDIYYNESSNVKTHTRGLRDFHNLFVKKMLVASVSRNGDTLIDLACGKGGDFPKWIASNLSFVFGVDIFKDNLENRLNGACARYLNFRKQFKKIPYALFVHGNSSENVRTGQAMFNEKGADITKAVFGQGDKDSQKLGKGVIRQFAKGADGFNITSCQFAIHYFCENKTTFYNFIRNVAECTKLGGYFIGTSYDGNALFNRLKTSDVGESIIINSPNGSKVWEVVKEYSTDELADDDTCLGHKISVFQESINKLIPEYLVNYTFLDRIMNDYGFRLIAKNEAKAIGLPDGSSMFSNLFGIMQNEIKNNPDKKTEYKESENMTANEKTISFLNRYFVYKKIASIDAEKLTTVLLNKDANEHVNEQLETDQLIAAAEELDGKGKGKSKSDSNSDIQTKAKPKPRVKKINAKLLLVPATEAVSEEIGSKAAAPAQAAKASDVIDLNSHDAVVAPSSPSTPSGQTKREEPKGEESKGEATGNSDSKEEQELNKKIDKTEKAQTKLQKVQAKAEKAQAKLQKELNKAQKIVDKDKKTAEKQDKKDKKDKAADK